MSPKQKSSRTPERDDESILWEARAELALHPLFAPMVNEIYWNTSKTNQCSPNGWSLLTPGTIHTRVKRHATKEQWMHVLAHSLLHLGFGHTRARSDFRLWNVACCIFVERFLQTLKIGQRPDFLMTTVDVGGADERAIYSSLLAQGLTEATNMLSTAGVGHNDMIMSDEAAMGRYTHTDFETLFAYGLRDAVSRAVDVAAGVSSRMTEKRDLKSTAQRARSWFISSYPLLGALAAGFELIEDLHTCQNYGISVAAIDEGLQEIYVNPAAKLDEYEARFVIAHELLHAGLRHSARQQGRDPYLWNVACDYVINSWLMEMHIGEPPEFGVLYDEILHGKSAEEVYQIITQDIRRYRKLLTLRGTAGGDMLDREMHSHSESVSLDEFYRRCLAQGLRYHEESGRGFLPLGLVEEIRALSQPPIPWDVELAQWFDNYFAPVEKIRSYARASRRQSASPDIPRPRYVYREDAFDARTFGVVLDTSGSMNRETLAKALGSIVSYALSRDVPFVRVVFCDAATYDQGFMPVEAIAERVHVRGRGGTVLQPGIDLLQNAKDFPKLGPILIITDGECDRLIVKRDHAFLLPRGRHLPFIPRGKVFFIGE